MCPQYLSSVGHEPRSSMQWILVEMSFEDQVVLIPPSAQQDCWCALALAGAGCLVRGASDLWAGELWMPKHKSTDARTCPGRDSPWPLERCRCGGTPMCTWGAGHDQVTLGLGECSYGCVGRLLPTYPSMVACPSSPLEDDSGCRGCCWLLGL